MDKIKYFMQNYGFAARKSLGPIIVLTLAIIPLGLLGYVINFFNAAGYDTLYIVQIIEVWCAAAVVVLAYCIAPTILNIARRHNLSARYYNAAAWGVLLTFCLLIAVIYGIMNVVSNLIAYNLAIPMLYDIDLGDLLQAMYAVFLNCALFGSIAFTLAKLIKASKYFLILTAAYIIVLIMFNVMLLSNIPTHFEFFFYQDNLLYLTLMTLPFVAAMVAIDHALTRRVLCW